MNSFPVNQKLIPLLLGVLFIGGCNTVQERRQESREQINATLQEAISSNERDVLSNDISSALLPPVSIELPNMDHTSPVPRFDVIVSGANARDFFISLAEGTPYSMVVHPKVSGRISLDMKGVSINEVMETVRSVYGYDYKVDRSGYQVFPNTLHTRIYKVDYLSVERIGESRISSSLGKSSSNSSGDSASGNSSGSSSGALSGGSTITTQSTADVWDELRQSLVMLVGADKSGESKVIVSPHSGVVMVRAMPQELRTVEEYLSSTMKSAHRQVVIEAKILEVTLNEGFESGINWASLRNDAGETGMLSLSGGSFTSNNGNNGSSNVLTSTLNSLASAAGAFTFGITADNFSTFIKLLETQGDVQVLSNPRVSTVNNQKAVIKVGNDEYFVTNITSDTTSGNTTSTSVDVELTPFFTGVSLDVTPQIADDGAIVMHIHPTISLVSEQTKKVETGQGLLSLPLANSRVRETDSVIRARSGQIVVLGGLMENRYVDEESSVPLLGDIPLLGALFRGKKTTSRKTELVILLKPVVIDSKGSQWQNIMESSSARLRSLGNQTQTANETAEKTGGNDEPPSPFAP